MNLPGPIAPHQSVGKRHAQSGINNTNIDLANQIKTNLIWLGVPFTYNLRGRAVHHSQVTVSQPGINNTNID